MINTEEYNRAVLGLPHSNLSDLVPNKVFQPDIDLVVLAAVGRLLRNRKGWPEGFRWDYSNPEHCALALANRTFGNITATIYDGMLVRHGSELAFNRIFYDQKAFHFFDRSGRMIPAHQMFVKPKQVAKAIETYLASQEQFGILSVGHGMTVQTQIMLRSQTFMQTRSGGQNLL